MAVRNQARRTHSRERITNSYNRNNPVVVRVEKAIEDWSPEKKPAEYIRALYVAASHIDGLWGRFETEAIETLQRAIIDPRPARYLDQFMRHPECRQSFELNFKYGRLLLLCGQYETALEYLERAQRRDPSHPEIERLVEAARERPHRNNFKRAAAQPEDPNMERYRALCEEAEGHSAQGNHQECVDKFTEAYRLAQEHGLKPDSLDRLYRRVAETMRRYLNRPEDGLQLAFAAYQRNPSSADNAFEYGMSLSTAGRFQEAADIYKTSYEQHPERTGLVKRICYNMARAGKGKEALEFVLEEHKKHRDDPRIILAVAERYAHSNRPEDGVRYLDMAAPHRDRLPDFDSIARQIEERTGFSVGAGTPANGNNQGRRHRRQTLGTAPP